MDDNKDSHSYMPKVTVTAYVAVFIAHACAILYANTIVKNDTDFIFSTKKSSKTSMKVSLAAKKKKKSINSEKKLYAKKLSKKSKLLASKKKLNSPSKEESQKSKASKLTKNFETSVISYTDPTYPRLAQKRKWTGKVRLSIKVHKSGTILEVTVLSSSGYLILDNSALKSAKKWRFKPFPALTTEFYKILKDIIFKF